MRINRGVILVSLAGLTIFFLGAAYTIWSDEIPAPVLATVNMALTPSADASTATPDMSATQAVYLTVSETGITAVTAAQLRQANLQFEQLSNQNLNLTRQGKPVPFFVDGEGDDARLYFFAEAHKGALEAPAVYRLETGVGYAMSQRDAQPTGEGTSSAWQKHHWEDNTLFVEQTGDGDIWTGTPLLAGGSWTYTFDDILPDSGSAKLVVRLLSNVEGAVSPQHHIEIFLNGSQVADHTWDGTNREQLTLELNEGMLDGNAPNALTIVSPGDTGLLGDTIYIDSVELEYHGIVDASDQQVRFVSDSPQVAVESESESTLVFDVTNSDEPTLLTNVLYQDNAIHFSSDGAQRQYFALHAAHTVQPKIKAVPQWPQSLKEAGWGADYIAIVADVRGFSSVIEPLLEHRREQGLRVASIPIDQIFDEFGYGYRSPQAIKDFLAYAAVYWEAPAPRYILLVGDATYDLRDHAIGRNKNLLPTPLVLSDSGVYLASDAWYALFENLPDIKMIIGRLPVQNAIQLRSMVEKTLAYETSVEPDANWFERALLIADDTTQFDEASEILANQLDQHGYRVYHLNTGSNKNINHDILNTINHGVGLINYTGYGGERVWGNEAALQSSDVNMLVNGMRLPILTTFTTRNGAFADPQYDTLVESLLRAKDRGIVAAVAPSGHPQMEKQLPLAGIFYKHLLDGQAITLGDTVLLMQAEVADDPDLAAIMPTINLLGDPALKIHTP